LQGRGKKMRKKNLVKFFEIMLIFLPLLSFGKSIYYYEPFSDPQSTIEGRGWEFNFPMSRSMIIYDWYNSNGWATTAESNFPATNFVSSGKLWIKGQPNNISGVHNSIFCGDGVKFDPKSNSSIGRIDASEEEPFGYTIVRYTTSIDAFSSYQDQANEFPNSIGNMVGYVSAWIVEDNGVKRTDTNSSWLNFAFFYDKGIKRTWFNTWGYFNGTEWDVPFSNLTNDIDMKSVGILSNYFQSVYDDMDPNHFNSYENGYSYPVTNELGINIVNNGVSITIYLNPDPLGNTLGLSNTWIKFAEFPVSWSNNLIVFLGHETPYYRIEPIETQFDDFLIRTVASNVKASISPNKIITNTEVDFTLEIEPEGVSSSDSGIGEIYIKKPSGYDQWQINTISVSNSYGNLTRKTSGTPNAGEFLVMDEGEELHIRFYMKSGTQNQIVRSGKIKVGFRLKAPKIPDGKGKDFLVYVDCRKHADTGIDWMFDNVNGIKYATTGKKRARPANSGALTVKVYTYPAAKAYIQAQPMVIGQEVQSVSVRIDGAGEEGRPDINYFKIYIPEGFFVSNNNSENNVLNIYSSKILLNRSISNIYLTNINGSNYIFVNYLPNGFDGVYGFDMINFNIYNTPSLPSGILYSNFHVIIEADSSEFLGGATWSRVDLPDSYIRVAVSNANAVGYITPTKVSINSSVVLNTNRYRYYIRNLANPGNDIKSIRIKVPGSYDIIYPDIYTSNGTSAYYLNGYIYVDYANGLIGKSSDFVEFTLRHTNTNLYSSGEYANFELYADNGNSLGYVLQNEDSPKTWSVYISPPIPSGENKFEPVVVYTSDITNEITNTIINLSPKDIDVRMVKIDFNTNYVEKILSIQSLLIGNNYTVVTNGGYYSVYLNYQANGTNLVSWYKDQNAVDRVVMRFIDKIGVNTFSIMPTNIAIPTYLYKINVETNDTNLFALCSRKSDGTNYLIIEYPPVELVSYISPSVIDTTTVTNSITMYFTNKGLPGNRIHKIYIPVRNDISTNIYQLTLSGTGGAASFNSDSNRIELTFLTPFDGGEARTLTFNMVDIVEDRDIYNASFLPSVSNDRGWAYNITNGNSYISFLLPKPKGGGGVSPAVVFSGEGGSVITQEVSLYITNSGVGSDNFQVIKLILPEFLKGDLLYVYSSKLNLWNTNSSVFTISLTDVTINYSNSRMLAGQSDVLKLTFGVGEKTLPTNGVWRIYAHNGFVDMGTVPATYFFEITNVTIGSRVMWATRPISYTIGDNFYTTETNKQFEITIRNGSTENLAVKKVGINIPWPFSISSVNDIVVSGYIANKSIVTNWIWLDYGTPLPGGQTTTLRITAKKELLVEPTNARWKPVYIYTNDVITYMHTNIVGSDVMNIVLPALNFYAYVTPNNVSRDEESVEYTFTITNVSEEGNNIYRVKIVPPLSNQIITNIELVSRRIPSEFVYSNDGAIYIDYDKMGTNIGSRDYDVIVVKGYDNQVLEGFSGSWGVYGVNSKTSAATIASKNPMDIGKSLGLRFVVPPYNSQYSIVNKQLNTLDKTNDISIVVVNTGESGNDITALRIYLPWPFITNNIGVLSALGGVLSRVDSDGTNFVELSYTSGKFTNYANDTIMLKVEDEYDLGETNSHIYVKAKYTTSGNNYIVSTLATGDTNEVKFMMPYPELSEDLTPSEIYSGQTNVELNVRLINRGQKNNNILWIKLTIPDAFTNDFDAGNIIDSMATNVVYADGIATLYYTNFAPNVTNNVKIRLVNTVSNLGESFTFSAVAYNGLYEANSYGEKALSLVRAPAAMIQSSYTNIPSTLITNTIKIEIDNGIAGNSAVRYVKFVIPDVFTNIVNVASTYGSVVTNELTNLVLYYPNGLAKGKRDVVVFNLIDKYDLFKMDGIEWKVFVNNGTGYAEADKSFSVLKQNMIIPKIRVTNLNLSQWFFIGMPTNTIMLVLSNADSDRNYAYSNVIELPSALSRVIGYTNTYNGSSITFEDSKISISYPSGFNPGEVDYVYFDFVSDIKAVTNIKMLIKSYNDSGEGPGICEGNVLFKGKDEVAQVYLSPKGQVLYSIDHSNDISYVIKNGMYDKGIEKVRIDFDTTKLEVKGVYSTFLGRNLSYSTTPTNLILNYDVSGKLSARTNDRVYISVEYNNNENWTNRMKAVVKYENMEGYYDTAVPEGESVDLAILLADFGRVAGIVLPGFANPNVNVLKDGRIAKNKFGEPLTVSAESNGNYLIDYVMPGVYVLQFTAKTYSTNNFMSNVVVVANTVTNVGVYKMRKDVFTPSSPDEQSTISLDDMMSEAIFKPGSVGEYFSLDIWITNFTVVSPDMKNAANNSKYIIPPKGDADNVKVYNFEMKGVSWDEREEQPLANDAIVKLYYNPEEIKGWGWSEDKLAVFYWRPVTKEWIRIGGVVDKENKYVLFKTSYLNRYYAVMGDNASAISGAPGFVSVRAEPKVFTPTSSDRKFGNIKLTFSLENPVNKVLVKIYDLKGNLVRQFERNCEYKEGMVYWDGKDEEGYDVKTGVYVYRIIAGNNVYSGTVIIAR
jgi:hypothetical protein